MSTSQNDEALLIIVSVSFAAAVVTDAAGVRSTTKTHVLLVPSDAIRSDARSLDRYMGRPEVKTAKGCGGGGGGDGCGGGESARVLRSLVTTTFSSRKKLLAASWWSPWTLVQFRRGHCEWYGSVARLLLD